jgi:hypothetical protein
MKTRRIPRKPPTKQERAMMKQIQALLPMSEQEVQAIVDKVLERVGIGENDYICLKLCEIV